MSTYDKDPDVSGPTGFRKVFDRLRNIFTGGGGLSGSSIIVQSGDALVEVPQRKLLKMRTEDPLVRTRREATAMKLEVFENRIKPQLEAKLRVAFHPENFARMFWMMHTSTNVMRRITRDVCSLYENPATRKLEEKTTQTESLGEQKTEAEGGTAQKSPALLLPAGETDTPEAAPTVPETGDPDIDALADVLELKGAKDENEETPFDKLMAVYDLDVLLDLVEQLCMVCPVVWVRPVVTYAKLDTGENDPATGKLSFVVYTPDHADVVPNPDNPNEALAFYYYGEEFDANGSLKRVTHFWTRDTYFKLDAEDRIVMKEDNELKRLPVTAFRLRLPRNGYYCDGEGDDLHEATLELCLVKTLQNSRAKDSAFKQLAIQGDPRDVPADMVMGGPSPVMLGDENTAVVLDLQANLEQFTQMWERREISLASTYGIGAAEYNHEGIPQSGFAKKLDRERVLQENRRRRKFFAQGEQDLYHNTATLLSVNPVPQVPKLPVDAKLVVDFAELTFEEDPQVQSRIDSINLKMNVISILDILRRSEPDMSDVELIQLAYRNKRINEAFMTSDQLKLVDLLATRANVGGSFGDVAGGGGAEGDKPKPGEDEKKPAAQKEPPQ